MNDSEISQIYDMICEYHEKYLKEKNVVLPKLYNGDSFSKDALTDRNYWIYDTKGRVIAIANPFVVDRCSPKIQKEIYERLKLKFERGK